MGSGFQIQEIIHQDGDGVIFQALDKQTGRLVSLQRFFLEPNALKNLQEKGESGVSLFQEGLDWMKSLNVLNLQKVLGGGFDEVDGTPFLVAEWIEGTSLKDAHEREVFKAGDGNLFEEQARATLLGIPLEKRSAVCLAEEDITISRNEAGEIQASFTLSPRRYFDAVGGMNIPEVDREDALQKLVEKFPTVEEVPMTGGLEATAEAAPEGVVLKSAQGGNGKGLLWGSLAAFLVILGVGTWLLLTQGKTVSDAAEAAVVAADDESKEKESDGGLESEESVSEEFVSKESDSVMSLSEVIEAEVIEAEEVLSDQVAVVDAVVEEQTKAVVEDPPQGLEENEESEEITSGEEKTQEKELAGAEDYYTWKDVDRLRSMNGQEVKFRGRVTRPSKSGGKGTLWYLDFGNYKDRPYVVLLTRDDAGLDFQKDWASLQGKELFVEAKVELKKGRAVRGSGVWLRIKKLSDLQFEPEKPKERVYQLSDLDDLRVISLGEKVQFEGEFRTYRKQSDQGSVYLYFKGGFSIVGRFEIGGPLSNQEFADKLEELKGQRVRLSGVRGNDDNEKIEVVIQLSEMSGVSEALSEDEAAK